MNSERSAPAASWPVHPSTGHFKLGVITPFKVIVWGGVASAQR